MPIAIGRRLEPVALLHLVGPADRSAALVEEADRDRSRAEDRPDPLAHQLAHGIEIELAREGVADLVDHGSSPARSSASARSRFVSPNRRAFSSALAMLVAIVLSSRSVASS